MTPHRSLAFADCSAAWSKLNLLAPIISLQVPLPAATSPILGADFISHIAGPVEGRARGVISLTDEFIFPILCPRDNASTLMLPNTTIRGKEMGVLPRLMLGRRAIQDGERCGPHWLRTSRI